jgi:virginiamycin A acetyltransferase
MKSFLKVLADSLAIALVFPAFCLYRVAALGLGPEKAFPGWSQLFSLFPGLTGAYLRRGFYRLVFPYCGEGAWIGFGTIFSHPTARIGRYVYAGAYCCLGDVTLGDDVLLGSQVSIINGSGQHGTDRVDVPIREQEGQWPRVTIGHNSWIGERSVVMADVGHHCLIGAGSVVTSPIPDYAVAVGVPARVLRYRQPSTANSEPAREFTRPIAL